MGRDDKGNLINSFSSLDALVAYIAASKYAIFSDEDIHGLGPETKEEVEVRLESQDEKERGVAINRLFLRAYSSTCRNALTELAEAESIVIPSSITTDIRIIEVLAQAVQSRRADIINLENREAMEHLSNFLGMDQFLRKVNEYTLTQYSAYHSNLTAMTAEDILQSQETRTYLFRPSSATGQFVLSYKFGLVVLHRRLQITEGGILLDDDEQRYSTIWELLERNRGLYMRPLVTLY